MNSDQKEKLQKLVNTSTILNPLERQEWLQLLELMDEKQLEELERILSANQSLILNPSDFAKASSDKSSLTKQENNSPPPPLLKRGGEETMSRFSHIVNLPKLEIGDQKPAPTGSHTFGAGKPGFGNQQPNAALDKPNFAQKLKLMLAEKELATSRPEFELELPSAIKKQEASASNQIVNLPPWLKPSSKPALPAVPKPLVYAEKKSLIPSVPANIAKSAAKPPASVKVPDNRQPVVLESSGDLTSLNVTTLQSQDFSVLLKKFKNLIAKADYHDIIFNLEKSPLYQAYIRTGQELLSKQTSFEQLGAKTGGENYLTRQQFEKLTDLLTQIQG